MTHRTEADRIRLVIITVPPPEVAEAVEALRAPLCRMADSRAALAYPPHVTLRTGVRVPPASLDAFLAEFGRVVSGLAPFPVRTEGIDFLTYGDEGREKYLVACRIAPTEPLRRLNRRLLAYRKWRKSDRTAFHPHMTLVFDDLSREDWLRLRTHIEAHPETYARTFDWTVDHVGLYERRGERWQPRAVLPLAAPAPVDG
jgi:2'-5' RNA ligase